MNRSQLEHIIRAAGDVLGENEVILVGSQAILGSAPDDLPHDVTLSMEADVMAMDDPDGQKALLINGTIGELSRFDSAYGYYAEGVEEALCRFPGGWRERLVGICTPSTNGVTGWCVEPHDVAVAKLLAGRDKDIQYVRALLRSGHLQPGTLLERAELASMEDFEMERIVRIVIGAARPGRKNPARHVLRRLRTRGDIDDVPGRDQSHDG